MRESQDHPLRPATVERLFLLWEQRGTKGIRVMIPKKGSLVPLHDKVILLPWERGTQNPCNSYWKTLCRRLFASSQRAAEESSFMLCLVQICPSNLEFSTEEVNQSSAILTKVQHILCWTRNYTAYNGLEIWFPQVGGLSITGLASVFAA